MNIQIPVKWLQELLALCGPEDHELRERVMASITAMNEQAAGPVVTPEPDAAIKEAMELVGTAMDSAMKAGELLLDSHEKFNAQFASAKSLKNSIESKLRALLATATGLPAQAEASDSHRELYFAAYGLCDGICEDHPAIGDVLDAGSYGRLCSALAKLDAHYGVTSPDERIAKDQGAATEHPTNGVHVNAVASIYVTAGGSREFDDWRVSLPAGNHLLYTAPQAQADARDAGDTCAACFFEGSCEHQAIQQKADRYDFIVSKKLILSGGTEQFGWPIAPFGSECDRYIDAAIAAAKGE